MFTVEFRNGKAAAAALLMAAVTGSMSGMADAAYSSAPVMEYTQLPQFCWSHFADGFQGLQYYMPRACGPGMNHYCDGLLVLNQAKKMKDVASKARKLQEAKNATLYTLGFMEQSGSMAACPITDHVQQTLRDIELQMQIYHVK